MNERGRERERRKRVLTIQDQWTVSPTLIVVVAGVHWKFVPTISTVVGIPPLVELAGGGVVELAGGVVVALDSKEKVIW